MAESTLLVTVLMPCLNESETLGFCIRKAHEGLRAAAVEGEVLVADNGSSDASQEIAIAEGARVVSVSERGYGAALYYGTLEARGRFVIMGDADGSYDFSNLEPFIAALNAGYDLVMGNRFAGGIAHGAMPLKNRYLGNPLLSGMGRLFFHCPVRDFHCGIRGFARDAFARMNLQTTGMEFASEMVIKATLLGMEIAEVPTTLAKDGRSRPPHLRPFRDGWRHLRFMLLYSPRWLFLYPGIAMILACLVLGVLVLPGPLAIAPNVALDVHTLLFSYAGVLLGFQAISFAFCARAYALSERLLPSDPTLERLMSRLSLEGGLTIGALLFVLGLGGAVYTVYIWSKTGFGRLDVRETLRTAIPAATFLCLGGQVMLTSFLLSFLSLRRRR